MIPDITPQQIARADQELASTCTQLDVLIDVWNECQPEYEAEGLDRMRRIAAYMRGVGSNMTPIQLAAVLAVAVERLAR